jgi:hypothetical protein
MHAIQQNVKGIFENVFDGLTRFPLARPKLMAAFLLLHYQLNDVHLSSTAMSVNGYVHGAMDKLTCVCIPPFICEFMKVRATLYPHMSSEPSTMTIM